MLYCSVCWSTKNDCPCTKEEREIGANLEFSFCGGCNDAGYLSSAVSKKIKQLIAKSFKGKTSYVKYIHNYTLAFLQQESIVYAHNFISNL